MGDCSYQKLQETGFDVPTSVQDATLAYHRENDKIGLFIEEQLTEDGNGEERTSALYEAYQSWCYVTDITLKTHVTLIVLYQMLDKSYEKDHVQVVRKPHYF